MATWSAGQRITAARLSQDSEDTPLSDDTCSVINTNEQWGTETVLFTNPGVAVKIKAWLVGRAFNSTDATSNPRVRIGISIDGGASYTFGPEFPFNTGTGAGATTRLPAVALHARAGTPTGDIVVKVEIRTDDTSVNFTNGLLLAEYVPQ